MLKDEVVKLKSGFMLDMNLEKSRVKETVIGFELFSIDLLKQNEIFNIFKGVRN